MPTATIRPATLDDAAQVAEIYAPAITDSATSFELEPPTAAEMARRIRAILPARPWLVCERGARLLGYAYGAPHRERPAYQWSVDVSVYVRSDVQGVGVGRGLYTSLLSILALQGFYNAYGGVTLPNPASVRLHESMGFTPVAVYRSVGYKFGRWHDVGWWHYQLQPVDPAPAAPRAFSLIAVTPEGMTVIASGESRIRL